MTRETRGGGGDILELFLQIIKLISRTNERGTRKRRRRESADRQLSSACLEGRGGEGNHHQYLFVPTPCVRGTRPGLFFFFASVSRFSPVPLSYPLSSNKIERNSFSSSPSFSSRAGNHFFFCRQFLLLFVVWVLLAWAKRCLHCKEKGVFKQNMLLGSRTNKKSTI